MLKNLSVSRKKEELDRILTSKNKEIGRSLLVNFGIDKYLGINNLADVILCDDIIGVWSQIDTSISYPFSKLERTTIKKVKEMLNLGINKMTVYKYGLYISNVVANILGISYKEVNEIHKNLAINSVRDIDISALDIASTLGKEPGNYISLVLADLEEKIVLGEIDNNKDKIIKYIKNKY